QEPLFVIREVDLRLAPFAEQAVRLDDRPHDDGLEGARRHGDRLLAEHLERDGVPVRLVVALESVGLTDLERKRPDEVEERDVVERLVGRELALALPVQPDVAPFLREEIENAMPLEVDLLLVLLEAARDET